jgi:3D (Asp-Asp-Asp) domain-containing protein
MKKLLFILFLLPHTVGEFTNSLTDSILCDEIVIDEISFKKNVTLTIYRSIGAETDSTPNITASGFKIDTTNAFSHKIIAVSRNLFHSGYTFNKKVKVSNAGFYDGVYVVQDLMNKRHENRIDILVDNDHPLIKLENIEINLLN